MKKILALLLAVVMVLSLAACGNAGDKPTDPAPVTYENPYPAVENPAENMNAYMEQSSDIYNDVLGEFYTAYEAAKAATNVSERYALMAVAEAKLMEAAVMLPLSSNGGNYALSRVAPYTAPNALWGNDSYRYHNVVVADKFITGADREVMKAKWAELKGTGTYEAWAKQYLTDNGYTLKNTYTLGYSSDPQTWDVLGTSRAADSEAIVNTYDGLYEYDNEGTLKPALAESYTVSEDGLTYTFKIKSGLKWVDAQGRVVADIKADDFVAGMQHMLDAEGGLEYLVQGIIVNATEYIDGDVVDFTQVGVKAPDDTTLVYTLCQPTSYFMTMLGYGVFAPMSREYYVSQGGGFGAEYAPEDEAYTYGKTPSNIAYCGPYTVTNATAENTIVFKANPAYWNAENINMETITWLFNDGTDTLKAYNDAVAGVLDGAGLNSAAVQAAKTAGIFDENHYVSSCDATSFMAFYNVNRYAQANINDETGATVKSPKTEEQIERATAALRNASFRRAISFATDRGAYNAQSVGEELKLTSLRNSYTPGNFVYLEEDVTISINGTDKTFAAGTYYGAIMQAQIDADGITMKVWDPTAEAGVGSSDGYDGWYNPEAAVAELNKAIEELAAIGIEVSAENPIYIDLPYYSASESYANRANSYKQSVETVLGGKVKVNLNACETSAEWYWAGYYTDNGFQANYDMYDVSGWGPDYGDPATYLDTFLPDGAGYMVKCIGLF